MSQSIKPVLCYYVIGLHVHVCMGAIFKLGKEYSALSDT